MDKKIKYLILLSLICFFSVSINAQKETDLGGSLTFEVNKDLSRFFTLSFDEEIRFVNNNKYNFDRSATTIGMDYSLIRRKLKVGAYYTFLYLYNSDYLFEARHRYFFNIMYKEDVGSFTLSWRGRFQGTIRDENRGEYNVNPKYVLRNRFQAEYNFWKSRWTPYLSCDLATVLNDPRYDLTRIRLQSGTEVRLTRTAYAGAFLRYDFNYEKGENNRLTVGLSYRIKM